jgi:hypothetical protein
MIMDQLFMKSDRRRLDDLHGIDGSGRHVAELILSAPERYGVVAVSISTVNCLTSINTLSYWMGASIMYSETWDSPFGMLGFELEEPLLLQATMDSTAVMPTVAVSEAFFVLPKTIPNPRYSSVNPVFNPAPGRKIWQNPKRRIIFVPVLTTSLIKKG